MVALDTMDLRVTDITRQLESRVSVGRHRRIVDIRPDLLEALDLPVEEDGQPLAYGIVNETRRQRLGDTDIIGENATDDDVIRLAPEITAAALA